MDSSQSALENKASDCCCVGYHPEGLAITVGGSNGKLLVLHAEGGLVVATISVADAALKALAYDADATSLAIGCEDGNIYICESKNHGYLYKMHTVLKNEWPILQVDWSSDGDCLMTAYRKDDFCEVALWRVADSKRLKSALAQTMDWPQHTCTLSHNILGIWKRIKDVFYLSCNRRGSKLAAGSQDGYIRIFKYPCKESDQGEYEEQKQSTQPLTVVRFLNMDHLISASGSAVFIFNYKK
ncbi:echinoderm microtubule-associated protein-like CG42247 isoform X3 [Stegodyphus dumicola]|uniref:echinoderm microtubule-associated protein-like CG42247 isoform X3 n=1 Tax=Stegodyphus dumicola TaxID=202533 RepID=UPI0015AE77CC|nr:echinoderm microtubule-associated protein-like CG42247 isoform X3 [Stegodyphus dumicola]